MIQMSVNNVKIASLIIRRLRAPVISNEQDINNIFDIFAKISIFSIFMIFSILTIFSIFTIFSCFQHVTHHMTHYMTHYMSHLGKCMDCLRICATANSTCLILFLFSNLKVTLKRALSNYTEDYLYQEWNEVSLPSVPSQWINITLLELYDESAQNATVNDWGFWEVQVFTGKSKSNLISG